MTRACDRESWKSLDVGSSPTQGFVIRNVNLFLLNTQIKLPGSIKISLSIKIKFSQCILGLYTVL